MTDEVIKKPEDEVVVETPVETVPPTDTPEEGGEATI